MDSRARHPSSARVRDVVVLSEWQAAERAATARDEAATRFWRVAAGCVVAVSVVVVVRLWR